MKTEKFDRRCNEGEDITKDLDMSGVRRFGEKVKRVNLDFPARMVHLLDREAKKLGVLRQSIIKVWVPEQLEHGKQ